MTRQEAIREYLGLVEQQERAEGRRIDKVAKRCGFVDYIDMLHRDRRITSTQAAEWEGLKV